MNTKIQNNLGKLIDVNIPIICIQDHDYARVDEMLGSVLGDSSIYEWNPATGTTRFGNKEAVFQNMDDGQQSTEQLVDFLYRKYTDEFLEVRSCYLLLKDVQDYVNIGDGIQTFVDPVKTRVKTLLQLIAQRKLYDRDFDTTIIIVAPYLKLPEEVEKYVAYLDITFPSDEEIDELIHWHVEVNEFNNFKEEDKEKLMPSLRGLTRFEIDRMLDMAMSSNGTLTADDQKMILDHKKQMVRKSGIVELVDTPANLNNIGGMDFLKSYLKRKKQIFDESERAKKAHLNVPKGIFIVGMPGCGKSLCAKATASLFEAPLLKLDMGSMMGKYVGESEANLRKAIQIAEAAAPCVLWIDEIEKGFSGIGGGNDIMTRMFGYFLSWLQDKTSTVYVIATANDAEKLPPELKRKGRFDEIFYVDLPNADERRSIFNVHLKNKNQMDVDISSELIDQTNGFNGADIEAVINEAIEQSFIENSSNIKLSPQILVQVAKETISISKSCKKQIDAMKKTFRENCFKDASTGKLKKEKKETDDQ